MDIKRAWLIPLVLGAIAAGMPACGDGGATTSGSSNPSGTGAGGAGGAGGSGGMGGGVMPECTTAADCAGTSTFCGKVACMDGKCGVMPDAPEGTPLPSQLYGDCIEKRCDDKGMVVDAPKDDDAYNDGKECTTEMCAAGVLMQMPVTQGEPCSTGVCDGAGKCVACLSNDQCGTNVCLEGKCVPETCTNTMKDGTETDIDCGGPNCLPCANDLLCGVSSHCASGVCISVGGAPKTCQAPTCMDTKINGNETDEDCGGADCPACSDNLACLASTDCASKVCVNNLCAVPTCTDAVQNGDEAGVDCGGACPTACP